MRRASLLIVPLALAAAIVLPATAEEAASTAASTQITVPHAVMMSGPLTLAGADVPTDNGMRVAIDPVTGKITRPSAAQLQALQVETLAVSGLRRSFAPIQVERADGTVVSRVDPELINYSVAEVGTDGAVAFRCVDGPSQSTTVVLTAGPTAAREVK